MSLPALPDPNASTGALAGAIERVIADVPAPRVRAVPDPQGEAQRIARRAARHAATLAGALALPPGPLGMLTVLPDLYLIWQTQRQMVADVYALYGRSAELTRTSMLYCLFRHAASQVLRDVAVRAGERFVVRELSAGALRQALNTVGVVVTQRVAGRTATRWVPLAGALAVGSYAYYDTLQVARTAQKLLAVPLSAAA